MNAWIRTEHNHLRMAKGLLGGGGTLHIAMAAVVFSWSVLVYAWFRPMAIYSRGQALVSVAAMIAAVLFLACFVAIIIVTQQRQQHVLLRLVPNMNVQLSALMTRIALMAIVCFPPALLLRALAALDRFDARRSMLDTISFADVPLQGWVSASVVLVVGAIALLVTFGWLRAPMRFAMTPTYFIAAQMNSWKWQWMTLVVCVLIVIGHRIWLRTDFASVASSQASKPSASGSVQLWERYRTLRMRRAARMRAAGNKFAAARALIGTRPRALFTLVAVLATVFYFSVAPAVFDRPTLGWFFAFMVVALLATPTPIPMTTILVVPVGVDRGDIGRLLMDVWMQDVHFRLVVGVLCGMVVRALLWRLEMLPLMHSPAFAAPDPLTALLWGPLAHAVGLYGAARAICWLCSASPRLMTNATLLNLLPMIFVALFSLLSVAVVWLLTGSPLRISTGDEHLTSVLFMFYGAVLLPSIGWLINRAFRHEWQAANMATIATAMQAWAARRQKSWSSL